MKNKEKFAKEIIEIACKGEGFAVDKEAGNVVSCCILPCDKCLFSNSEICSCSKLIERLSEKEYVEQQVDWSKVEIDTPILVRRTEDSEWRKRYFAGFDGKYVYAYACGATSWSHLNIVKFEYAKLLEGCE